MLGAAIALIGATPIRDPTNSLPGAPAPKLQSTALTIEKTALPLQAAPSVLKRPHWFTQSKYHITYLVTNTSFTEWQVFVAKLNQLADVPAFALRAVDNPSLDEHIQRIVRMYWKRIGVDPTLAMDWTIHRIRDSESEVKHDHSVETNTDFASQPGIFSMIIALSPESSQLHVFEQVGRPRRRVLEKPGYALVWSNYEAGWSTFPLCKYCKYSVAAVKTGLTSGCTWLHVSYGLDI